MNILSKLLLLLALMSAPSLVAAQSGETTTSNEQTTDQQPAEADSETSNSETEEAPEADVEDGAEPEAAPPAEQVVAVHGDWQIRCRSDNENCFMYQLGIDAREIPISEVSVVTLDADDGRVAGFTIVTPLRTLLTEGVTLQIDNGSQQRYQFGWCAEPGCYARFAVREDGLNQFKRGNKARLTVRSVERPDAPVILDVSLAGFTAAFEDLASR